HESVQSDRLRTTMQQPAWLTERRPQGSTILLFWSGGKDSFLTHRELVRTQDHEVVWLTTFDAKTGLIAHQDLHIDTIVTQAEHLQVPVIGVPLHSSRTYIDHILSALTLINDLRALAFGDLHLEHIRGWREDVFGAHPNTRNLTLLFPLWHRSYDQLLIDLEASGADCRLSAVVSEALTVAVGDPYDRHFLAALPEDVDPFGECGEFHTVVSFPEVAT
ncbi:MAG: hypothetical protein AAF525_03925, partial [Pseudomonadota bacterium]